MSILTERNAEYVALVEAELERQLKVDMPPRLSEPMSYSVLAGGKRLRPCLTLACCDMLAGDRQAALTLGCALELIHTYSLIHDDLPCMDDDDFRRGRPSNHKVYGEAFALLAGDGLLSLAFELMLKEADRHVEHAPNYGKAMLAVANGSGVCGMVAGQAMDLDMERTGIKDAAMLKKMHSLKTGALIKASLLAGAYTAAPDQAQLEAVAEFGSAYGLLFQITDDILDVTGDFESMGKTLGKDAKADKVTYVTLYGLERAKHMALEAAAAARESLHPFGEGAAYLTELTEYTLSRRK